MSNNIEHRSHKSNNPNYLQRRIGAAALAGGILVGSFLLGKEAIKRVERNLKDASNPFHLPDKNNPTGQKAIQEAINEGKMLQVNIDPEHPSLYSISEAVTPKGEDPRPLADSLQAENSGSTLVKDGEAVYLPASDEASKLQSQQTPADTLKP